MTQDKNKTGVFKVFGFLKEAIDNVFGNPLMFIALLVAILVFSAMLIFSGTSMQEMVGITNTKLEKIDNRLDEHDKKFEELKKLILNGFQEKE